MRLRNALLGVVLAAAYIPASADTDWISLIWHNDLFVGQDGGGYTNGGYISWYDISDTEPDEFGAPWLVRPLFGWLIDDHGDDFEVSGHTIGQSMITPKDISKDYLQPNDAPYAGLLFWRASYIAVNDRRADSVSVTLGIVGPSSGADEAQSFIHRVTGSTKPQGWDYQIKDEPVGKIERASVWRFGPEVDTEAPLPDLLLVGGVGLGNLDSSIGGALIARYGTRLDRSFATAHQLMGRVSNPMAVDGGWNLYLGVGANYVYNQIFISGSGIRSGPSADLRHDQYSAFGGVSYSWRRLSVTFSLAANSELDRNGGARQQFGSLSLAWRL